MRTAKFIYLAASIAAGAVLAWNVFAAAPAAPAGEVCEYVTIRWAGRDNTHLIRPGGEVEFIGPQLRTVKKPDRTDERAFYMNVALNGMAKEGFELVAMTHDEMVLKRRVRPFRNDQ